MLDTLTPYLAWELSRWEAYGLFFLLGSYAVATLSDIKHMSAQREFMDIWWAFTAILALIQLHQSHYQPDAPLIVKWALIGGLALATHRRIGILLRLAPADIAATTATAILLSPLLIIAYYAILKLLAIPAAKLLARKQPAYPFMPVITTTTLMTLALAITTGTIG